jgi:hypothetical protein
VVRYGVTELTKFFLRDVVIWSKANRKQIQKLIFFFGDRFHRSVFDDSPGAQILKLFLHVWAVSMTNGHREMVKTILDSVLESPPKHQIA